MNSSCFIIALLKCPGIGTTKALKYIIKNDFCLEKCYLNIDSVVSIEEFRRFKLNYTFAVLLLFFINFISVNK